MIRSLKTIALICTATTLTGCAAMVEPLLDNSEASNQARTYIHTGFHPKYSYAFNVGKIMFEDKDYLLGYEEDRTDFLSHMHNPKYGFLPVDENKATKSWNFNNEKMTASRSLTNDLYTQSLSYGPSAVSAALSIASLSSSSSRPKTDPKYDYMSDQVMIFVPRSRVKEPLNAELTVYDAIKSAFEKAAPSVSKEKIEVIVERGCKHTKITGRMKANPEKVWMELYLKRLKDGIDPTLSDCEKPLTSYLKTGMTKDLPMWLNKGKEESAWFFSRQDDSHLFLKDGGRNYAIVAAKYLPDNYFIYLAPRTRQLPQKNELVKPFVTLPPLLVDNKGEHKFNKPTKSEIPVW